MTDCTPIKSKRHVSVPFTILEHLAVQFEAARLGIPMTDLCRNLMRTGLTKLLKEQEDRRRKQQD